VRASKTFCVLVACTDPQNQRPLPLRGSRLRLWRPSRVRAALRASASWALTLKGSRTTSRMARLREVHAPVSEGLGTLIRRQRTGVARRRNHRTNAISVPADLRAEQGRRLGARWARRPCSAPYHTRTTPMAAVRGVRRGPLRAAGAANGLCCGPGGLVAGRAGTTDESENHGVPGSNPGPAT
jgi:hypothetical protein